METMCIINKISFLSCVRNIDKHKIVLFDKTGIYSSRFFRSSLYTLTICYTVVGLYKEVYILSYFATWLLGLSYIFRNYDT